MNRLNIKALQKALIKNMFDIAKNPKKYRDADPKESTDAAMKKLQEDYEKFDNGKHVPTTGGMEDIDLENVTIIKENQ
jgi:hypothetical protein